MLPDEIPELKENLHRLAEVLEKTLDIDAILQLAESARELSAKEPRIDFCLKHPLRIGVADDEAFCFFYEDNFRLLRKMGQNLYTFLRSEIRNYRLDWMDCFYMEVIRN